MPPSWWKAPANRLKPCSEFLTEACEITPHDGCCSAAPCKMCLEWDEYGQATQFGSADFVTSSWTGTVGGHAFNSYWQRNYATDECEYIVTLGGEEVYRATCYEGASCRDPQGEVEVSTAYFEGTLRWQKYEPLELQLTPDPDTGCRDFFCGTCRCSCECVCVTITESDGTTSSGELCNISYECDAPVWAGSVGYYELSIALGRDQYGECIITLTVDGEEQEPVAAPGCASMTATVTLYDGTTIEVRCKQCLCEQFDDCPCCPGWRQTASASVEYTTIPETSDCGSFSPTVVTGDFSCDDTEDPEGTVLRLDSTYLNARVFCQNNGDGTYQWKAQYRSAISGGTFEPPISDTWADAEDFDFICPTCNDPIGEFSFIAYMACETSGGVVSYPVLVQGIVTIGC